MSKEGGLHFPYTLIILNKRRLAIQVSRLLLL
jgi:hypothetical protein